MQPKKRIILQDESLEVKFKMNKLKNKCWYKWPMKTSEKMATKKWENSSNTWFLSNEYLGEHHMEFWAFLYHSFHNLNPANITTHE